jgi:PAS domain S-box-containing protein
MSHQTNYKSAKIKSLTITLAFFFIVLLPIWWMTNTWYADKLIQDQKIQDTVGLELIKNSLSHAVSRRSALFEGLCAFVESTPTEEHLKAEANILMRGLYSHSEGIRVMALAPGGIQKFVYPLKGNEKVVGHDILHDKRPHVQKAIKRALKTKKIIINGPYTLRQGGLALVLRKAIFADNQFWGLAAMVIDIPPILQESGFMVKKNSIQLALKNNNENVFWGDKDIFKKNPLIQKISLLDGYWELAGIPVGGLHSFIDQRSSLFKIGSLFITVLLSIIFFLIYYRQKDLDLKIQIKTKELSDQIDVALNSEKKLRESEERFRSMMEQMTDPVYICSPDYKIDYMNPAMKKLLGRDAIGESCYKALYNKENECHWCVFDRIKTGISIETTNKSPLFNKTFRITNMPLKNKNGDISKMTIFRDITDYLKAVNEKEKSELQLLKASKMESIGNLAGGIAHDFNNILSSIIGFSDLALNNVEKGSELEDDILEIHRAGKRAAGLVKQILIFARKSDVKLHPIKIRPIADEALKLLKSTIPSNIEIMATVDSDFTVLANGTQIHQIFMNLCTNGSQAMEKDGGKLFVSVTDQNFSRDQIPFNISLSPGKYVNIKISDTGMGIPKTVIDSIFEPYFTTKEMGKGTGLGLATVHGIVEKISGKIIVESSLGEGTKFEIYIPATQDLKLDYPENLTDMPKGKESILLVDDEKAITKMNKRFLDGLGYKTVELNDSNEALKLFENNPDQFDLIVTDMTMPNMTGDKLAAKILEIRENIPVILCTGYSKILSKEEAKKTGLSAYIEKPIDKVKFSQTIRQILDHC